MDAVDHGHTPSTQLALEAVAIAERGIERG
jgi:hypothetical protein